jgi:hypothetical protein
MAHKCFLRRARGSSSHTSFCSVPVCVCNKLFVRLFALFYVVDVFLPLVSVEEEAWEPGVAIAQVRIPLGDLGLTRFWPGVGVSSLHRLARIKCSAYLSIK